ncbi:hypothetical protein A2334_05570 [Candidatus Roizmanbacteria bacterium RIFOXYB2_FULL_38_10]|uniref:Type II secretion system protein GspG C-terminal domain-containing protein n=1 Tax=Candidatus Roizmanbacteria bacterium RIFOXYD1_FULL_38_12 TaxID=1802093 RepID=A0A1F7L0Q1_9BACT|nr:MAG: hypothetical protein A3K47_02690 [Candidatus Roizmanbacteria bacterium RIFOXYA2_FULL_38_14]OGK63676.1 MAG: hypothetical protein A3K27_02690 [Candidatus Roizmanbacteria bacterium RIFOXYA1_FULL_37_12]OGK65522.1 MAG: hypothetical protein A3K38_02690 [Candidatus Roizmanbacteria bacterium RIFOXYB1_FULL_40_23]OGK68306.1 MAG: hypothetical protein A2334_05570 [Candidatus Roizmanbacteria bacterium RIFOXYB2_FULL_38_10]OGK69927.1 MAG: hypothetical protein A3K21_02695 [Candidatus Roizmanbacteria ba
MKTQKGFTLIELLVIIIILGILAALISGNFLSSLQKGRDSKRKNDLVQIQRALELYYDDHKAYPSAAPPFGSKFCSSPNCPTNSKVYMIRTPNDPNSSYTYSYSIDSNRQYYYLFSCIENYLNDSGAGVSRNGYCEAAEPNPCGTAPTCGDCGRCKFVVGSANALPLPTMVTPE